MLDCHLLWDVFYTLPRYFAVFRRSTLLSVALPFLFAIAISNNVVAVSPTDGSFVQLADEFDRDVRPVLQKYCIECHGDREPEGDLNLGRFVTLADVRGEALVWQTVQQMLNAGDMPPEESQQLTAHESKRIRKWIDRYLLAEATANAGDPGEVLLRRLSNAELNYTVHDLTGQDLRLADQFPVDGAAGEGFTNTGESLSMSPALLQKYVAAAEEFASHVVLLPNDVRFSQHQHVRDWEEEIANRIRAIYERHTDGQGLLPLDRYFAATLQLRDLRAKRQDINVNQVARDRDLNPKYLQTLWELMAVESEAEDRFNTLGRTIYPISAVRSAWRNASSGNLNALIAETREWQRAFWAIDPVTVSWYGKWQTEKQPLAEQRTLRFPIRTNDQEHINLHLLAVVVNPNVKARVRWRRPRFEAKGQPTLLISELLPELPFAGEPPTDLITDASSRFSLSVPPDRIANYEFVVDAVLADLDEDSPIVHVRVEQSMPHWEDRAIPRSVEIKGLPHLKLNELRGQPVVRFAPGDYVMLGDSSQLRLPAFTITSVVNYAPNQGGEFRSIFNNYHNPINWGKGFSLQLMNEGWVYFFTTAGTSASYSPMRSSEKIDPGYHVISATYTDEEKRIYADGRLIGEERGKGIDYGSGTKAAVGALREFGQHFESGIAEVIMFHGAERQRQMEVELALAQKYGIENKRGKPLGKDASQSNAKTSSEATSRLIGAYKPVLWLSADRFVKAEQFAPSLETMPRSSLIGHAKSASYWEFVRQASLFRQHLPIGLCFNKITPLNEGQITLRVHYREDDQLGRLILNDDTKSRLDTLWDELSFIGRGAIREHESFDTFIGFTTQVSREQTAQFEEFREPIRQRAIELQAQIEASEPRHVDRALEFARRAWRRPLEVEEETELRGYYRVLRDTGTPHDAAVRSLFVRIFLSPNFLYRIEVPQRGAEPTLVSDWELANRLSYFLWSSVPDSQLQTAAKQGHLTDDLQLLRQHTRRMLQDRRIRRLATEFACQWLGINDLRTLDGKNERYYPTFKVLRDDMHEEAVRFFADLFRRDGSVLELIDCDHAFVNTALAKHYGLEPLKVNEWQRVDGVGKHSRGGILSMAAVHSMQSGATRTSPVLRGNWIVETLLGERLPDPPATVPELPDAVSREGKTIRELTEQHVSDRACSKCHVRIDPFGFSLESFDAIGRLRRSDLGGHAIDTRAKLRDGTEFEGLDGLRSYLLKTRRDDFLRQLCRKLLGFALGRPVQLSDQLLINDMLEQLSENDYRFSAAVQSIVTSQQFRMARGIQHQ
ncbi:MAG: hypothetical protein CMJ80_02010 [Planctomycetaceae bacterium]|nr:hypothetical protein [Planctomycetaceae bacterium]